MIRVSVFVLLSFFGLVAFGQEAPVQEIPQWLDKALEAIQAIPVVGPIAEVVLKYLGVFAVITTSLTGFLITSVRALVAVLNLAKLVEFAARLKAFEESKVMYYLRYFSLFNASKKPKVEEKKA